MIGVGALLRGEGRAGRPRGVAAAAAMAEGRLVDDTLIFEVLTDRLRRSEDIKRNGWLLDGFPRTQRQAEAMVGGEMPLLRPDAVVLIERPDELVKVPSTPETPPSSATNITKHTRKHTRTHARTLTHDR